MGLRRVEEVAAGQDIPPLAWTVRREEIRAYAEASGDRNPLHLDEGFARSVGFPGVIAHGMLTMAHLVRAVTDWLGDPGGLEQVGVQFRAAVFPGETVVARGRVEEVDPATCRAWLSLWAEVERDGERVLAIKNGRARVRLAR